MLIRFHANLFSRFVFFFIILCSASLYAQPDLIVVESTMKNSLHVETLNATDQCYLNEGCINGLGQRDLIRFSTHIRNIGNQDFYVGAPPGNPAEENDIWEYDECHGHWHYEGYADYQLYDENGEHIPIGFKNGFCLMDIECTGGGTLTYTCSNQGISAGCGDIYSAGLDCQWIDITDVEAGRYRLVLRVNWDQDPDANGNSEASYTNNSGDVCFDLIRSNGEVSINIVEDGCNPATDCSDITLSITLDNYPEETSWEVKNSDGNTIATGGTYGDEPDGNTITQVMCLEDGCYDFIINDTYGDGICCAYGAGSYTLSDDSGNILASGGQFTTSEASAFCISTTPPPCIDNDNDGLCIGEDCDDNNGMVPGPPGASCDDGNPNTEHDEIGADGCSCVGVPIGQHDDCDDVLIMTNGNYVIVNGIDVFPHVNIQVFNANWNLVDNCIDDCGTTYGYGPVEDGVYYVSVKTFDASWQYECDILIDIIVINGACTDNDNDGFCEADDCDDNDPNLPTIIGSPCDDGNTNTSNDQIQSDGCTCLGTIEGIGDCDQISITTSSNTISISQLNFPHTNIQVFTATWSLYYSCVDNCGNPMILNDIPEGDYIISVKTFNEQWQDECDLLEYRTVLDNADCIDSDNDGVCLMDDCDDNNPLIPAPVGTLCNDGDDTTINDQIQIDECTCAGTPETVEGDCQDIIISTSPGTITIEALNFPHTNIQIFTSSWSLYYSCVDNCGDPMILNNIPQGAYIISVKTFDELWQDECDLLENISVIGGGACTDNDQDGICEANDCDDTNPNIPVAPGSICNDGNINTINDEIQEDGCTCEGVLEGTGCDLNYITGDGNITITGLNTAHVNLKLFDASFNSIFTCIDNCQNPQIIDGLAGGTYYLDVQLFDESWQSVCTISEFVEISNAQGLVSNSGSEYLYFTAIRANNGDVNLHWVSNTDYRNSHFQMERSTDKNDFNSFGQIPSQLLGNNPSSYKEKDTRSLDGKSYYRIKEIFADGTFRYSPIRTIELSEKVKKYNIFPNPSSGKVYLDLLSYADQPAKLMLVNNLGQIILTQNYDALEKELIQLDIEDIPGGVYFIFIQIEGEKPIGEKLIISKL